jgi:hypothetical protein
VPPPRVRYRLRTLMIAVGVSALYLAAFRASTPLGLFLALGSGLMLLERARGPAGSDPATGRLAAGAEVRIYDPEGREVAVEPAVARGRGGSVASGTRARVISDDERPEGAPDADRKVMVCLLEGAYRGQGRKVDRSRLRPGPDPDRRRG